MRPVFFSEDWAHTKYYGWDTYYQISGAGGDLKIIKKRTFCITRYLVLVQGMSADDISRILQIKRINPRTSEIMVHDFDDPGAEQKLYLNRIFARCRDDQRLLNTATFVVGLDRDESMILQGMSSDYRRKIRKATEQRITVTRKTAPSKADVDAFMARLTAMSAQRGLYTPARSLIDKMFAAGDLLIVSATQGNEVLTSVLVYLVESTGFFLYGVGGERRNDGSGPLVHWEIMRELKLRGKLRYDLGGVPMIDDANGIYRFKKGFGGDFVLLGTQYIYDSPLVRMARALRSSLRRS